VTQGDWKPAYGVEGACLFTAQGPVVSETFPGTIEVAGASYEEFAALSSDPRALELPGPGARRLAAAAFGHQNLRIQVSLPPSIPYPTGIYLVDWNNVRAELRVKVFDDDAGGVELSSQEIELSDRGTYVLYRLWGRKTIQVENLNEDRPGSRPTFSGFFVGGAGRAHFHGHDLGSPTGGIRGGLD